MLWRNINVFATLKNQQNWQKNTSVVRYGIYRKSELLEVQTIRLLSLMRLPLPFPLLYTQGLVLVSLTTHHGFSSHLGMPGTLQIRSFQL